MRDFMLSHTAPLESQKREPQRKADYSATHFDSPPDYTRTSPDVCFVTNLRLSTQRLTTAVTRSARRVTQSAATTIPASRSGVRALSVRRSGNNLRSAIGRHQSISPFMFSMRRLQFGNIPFRPFRTASATPNQESVHP
jgi:hypothetical protein